MTLQTVVYIINLKNSYSIFRRTTGFGKLDSLFLFFRRVFSAPSAVSFCLLFVPSTGLPKGEIIFISTAGGDQEPSFLVVLKRKRRNKIDFFFLPTVFSRGKETPWNYENQCQGIIYGLLCRQDQGSKGILKKSPFCFLALPDCPKHSRSQSFL